MPNKSTTGRTILVAILCTFTLFLLVRCQSPKPAEPPASSWAAPGEWRHADGHLTQLDGSPLAP